MTYLKMLAGALLAITLTQTASAQSLPDGLYHTIQQKSSGRFVDAYTSGHDAAAVLRHVQFNDTQKWRFTPVPGVANVYTIQQVSNARFLDAYEDNVNGRDHGVVTRTAQDNPTQRWRLVPLGNNTYRVRQQSTDRFLDAYPESPDDFALVTRNQQDNDTQAWVIKPVELKGSYIIQHRGTGRSVDAYQTDENDHAMVHRPAQKNLTQRWEFTPLGDNTYTIRQKSSGRFMDAYSDNENGHNFGMVTRDRQNNDTQKWTVIPTGNDTFKIRQKSSGRYVDAYVSDTQDFALVTREAQNDGSQEWKIVPQIRGTYTVQQKSNARYLDAHLKDTDGKDYKLVTNPSQNNDSQHWLFTPLGGDTYTIQQWHEARFVQAYTGNANDHRLVTRPFDTSNNQKWTVTYLGGDDYAIRQKSTGRYMDAYQDNGRSVVTRGQQNNDTQQWVIRRASFPRPDVAFGSPDFATSTGHASVKDTMDDLVLEHLRRNRIPGATVAVTKDGKLVATGGYGYESVETKAPMQPTSRTRIGSVSKMITAIGFMKLSEQTPGLSPQTSVYGSNGALSHPSYMTAIENHQSQHDTPAPQAWLLGMKINHLLSHTSGIDDPVGKKEVVAATPGLEDETDLTLIYRKVVQYGLTHRALGAAPGTKGRYENRNLGLVGHIIAEVSGQDYRSYILANVLIPLGLSGIVPEDGQTDANESEPHGLSHDGMSTWVYDANPSTTGLSAGGWMASAQQMARLMVATDKLDNQADILSHASIDQMETAPYPNATSVSHALGWGISCQNGGVTQPPCQLGHSGALTGGQAYIVKYQSGYMLDGQDVGDITVAILLNIRKRDGIGALAEDITKLVAGATISSGYDLFPGDGRLVQAAAN